jgi:arylsulfatase A
MGLAALVIRSADNKARWTDEEMPTTFLSKAKEFIETNKRNPFFLYYT